MNMYGQRKRKKGHWTNRIAVIGVTLGVFSLSLVVNVKCSTLRRKDMEYQEREAALQQQYDREVSRASELEEYQIYVQTKEYIEEVAKQKLGLVKPDEILLKPSPHK